MYEHSRLNLVTRRHFVSCSYTFFRFQIIWYIARIIHKKSLFTDHTFWKQLLFFQPRTRPLSFPPEPGFEVGQICEIIRFFSNNSRKPAFFLFSLNILCRNYIDRWLFPFGTSKVSVGSKKAENWLENFYFKNLFRIACFMTKKYHWPSRHAQTWRKNSKQIPPLYICMQISLYTLLLTLFYDRTNRKQMSAKCCVPQIFLYNFSSFHLIISQHAVDTKRRNVT